MYVCVGEELEEEEDTLSNLIDAIGQLLKVHTIYTTTYTISPHTTVYTLTHLTYIYLYCCSCMGPRSCLSSTRLCLLHWRLTLLPHSRCPCRFVIYCTSMCMLYAVYCVCCILCIQLYFAICSVLICHTVYTDPGYMRGRRRDRVRRRFISQIYTTASPTVPQQHEGR